MNKILIACTEYMDSLYLWEIKKKYLFIATADNTTVQGYNSNWNIK